MLSILFYCQNHLNNLSSENLFNNSILWMFLFVGRIIELKNYFIDPKICFEAVIKLLEKPNFLEHLDSNTKEMKVCDDEDELEKSSFLINIIKKCENLISNDEKNELMRVAEISQL